MWQSEPIKTAQINDVTRGTWQVARRNLTDAVIPYYVEVRRAFPDTSQGVGKLVEEQGKRIPTILGLLGRMEGRGITPLTWKELEQLDKLYAEFCAVHKQIRVWVQDSILLQKGSEKAIKDVPIVSREDRKAVGRAPSGGPGGMFRQLGLGRSLGLGVMGAGGHAIQAGLKPMLGPLAGPLMATISAATAIAGVGMGTAGYLKRRKARRMGGPALPGISPGVAGMAMPGIAGTGIVEGMPSTYPRDVRGRFTRRGPLTGIDNIEKALFKFFNRRALKAKWTRRLLRAAEKGAGKKGTGGLLDSFAKLKLGIGGVLGVLGGAGGLKAAGLVGAIAFTTVQLYRAGKVAIEWYNVHKNAAKSIKKQTDKQQELLQNLSDTLWEKGQKAKAEGDEPARRGLVKQVIRIQAEKLEKEEKPGMWETLKSGAKAVAGDVKRVANFRDGGVVTRPTLGVIAEEQPEIVTPLSAGNVMDVLKAIKENTAKAGIMTPAAMDTFMPPFDLADPLLNQLNTTGSLG